MLRLVCTAVELPASASLIIHVRPETRRSVTVQPKRLEHASRRLSKSLSAKSARTVCIMSDSVNAFSLTLKNFSSLSGVRFFMLRVHNTAIRPHRLAADRPRGASQCNPSFGEFRRYRNTSIDVCSVTGVILAGLALAFAMAVISGPIDSGRKRQELSQIFLVAVTKKTYRTLTDSYLIVR